ncbi:MAG: acyl-CoA dehydrogenase family protein [Kineosporiaceae bacterium]
MPVTHTVTNQPPPLEGYDVYTADAVLREAVHREGAAWADDDLGRLGRLAGSPEAISWGSAANRASPELRTHDRFGVRIDEVAFHPAYHQLLRTAVEHGLHAAPWAAAEGRGAHVARAAGFLVWSQVDAGVGCPVSMTYASVPVLRERAEVAAGWLPAVTSRAYDPVLRPVRAKPGALVGMAMTEKQGGSDVRANTTRAIPDADGAHRLTGHKWFCSAPMSDAFLVLAQAPGGLSCFLLPRVLDGGERNAIRLQRLKDKLGNRSNASAEIELDGARAELVGEEGRGVATIARMVALTRLDCVLGTAALLRQATAQAIHHARHRTAFGRLLADQPLMRNVLADLALESEAATTLGLRLAGAVDRSGSGGTEAELLRLGTALGKYLVCKRGPGALAEALECLGGNGYVEESVMPRLYREAPVNSVWEGSGNVNALDVLRALRRSPATADALLAEIGLARGGDARLDAFARAVAEDVRAALGAPGVQAEWGARSLVARMALALQAALLVRHAPAAVADAFCTSRLVPAAGAGATLGTLPAGIDAAGILERHAPEPEAVPA